MFNFVNHEKIVPADEHSAGEFVYELDLSTKDYMLNRSLMWDHFRDDVYVFQIGNKILNIPATMYILISDEYGTVDWIHVEEIIDRDITVVTLDREFTSWQLHKLELLDQKTSEVYSLPKTSNALPISTDGDCFVVISKSDQHNLTEGAGVDIATVI